MSSDTETSTYQLIQLPLHILSQHIIPRVESKTALLHCCRTLRNATRGTVRTLTWDPADGTPVAALPMVYPGVEELVIIRGGEGLPDITTLPRTLKRVNLHGSLLDSIVNLAAFTALQQLDISGTWVSDLGPLSACTALQHLNIGGCAVDLAPLSACNALRHLSWDDGIGELAHLPDCTAL